MKYASEEKINAKRASDLLPTMKEPTLENGQLDLCGAFGDNGPKHH